MLTALHIGFTGTRHGDCIGADAEFHAICRMLTCDGDRIDLRIAIHPGPGEHRAGCVGDDTFDVMPHMKRNRAIVNASSIMIAAPHEDDPQPRGGTWATIAMARKAIKRGALRGLYVIGRGGDLLDHSRWK